MKHLHRLLFPPAWSIAAKISLALLSAVLIPMSFNAYYNLQHSLYNAEQSEYRQLELLATSTASRLDQLIIDSQNIVSQVSTEPKVLDFIEVTTAKKQQKLQATTVKKQQELQSAVQSTLNNIFRSNKNYDAIFLIDRQGNCLASTNSSFVNRNFSSREYFREAIQGNNYVSDLITDSTTKKSGFYLSQTIWSSQGKIIGIAVLKIKESNINEIIDRLRLESGSYAFLVDSLGVIINHPEKNYIYHSLTTLSPEVQTKIAKDRRYPISQIESLDLPELAEAIIGSQEPGHSNYFSPLEDNLHRVGFAPLEVQQWVMGISKPKTAFVQNSLIWENILNLIIVGAIAAAFALLLARSISKPIRKLIKTAKSLEQGNFEYERLLSISHSQDDIGQLVRVFIHMAQEVESREKELKQKVQKLNIEVDRAKKERQVEEVTGTKYFQQLQLRAKKLRQRNTSSDQNWQEHFQQLQKKAQKMRIRSLTTS